MESNHLSIPVAFLYVKKWNGNNWVLLGTSFLNMASAATRIEDTAISCDGTNPVVAWSEWTTSNGVQTDADPTDIARVTKKLESAKVKLAKESAQAVKE